ncbi:hypothetical protein ACFTWF_39730 [Rhodococcus sp. NPDC056960]|uniref:hypothetical protein n=1 Tax=Rhodococcus sp. NPDC056960 TaxID=3345982 RepID=UPI003631FB23
MDADPFRKATKAHILMVPPNQQVRSCTDDYDIDYPTAIAGYDDDVTAAIEWSPDLDRSWLRRSWA